MGSIPSAGRRFFSVGAFAAFGLDLEVLVGGDVAIEGGVLLGRRCDGEGLKLGADARGGSPLDEGGKGLLGVAFVTKNAQGAGDGLADAGGGDVDEALAGGFAVAGTADEEGVVRDGAAVDFL